MGHVNGPRAGRPPVAPLTGKIKSGPVSSAPRALHAPAKPKNKCCQTSSPHSCLCTSVSRAIPSLPVLSHLSLPRNSFHSLEDSVRGSDSPRNHSWTQNCITCLSSGTMWKTSVISISKVSITPIHLQFLQGQELGLLLWSFCLRKTWNFIKINRMILNMPFIFDITEVTWYGDHRPLLDEDIKSINRLKINGKTVVWMRQRGQERVLGMSSLISRQKVSRLRCPGHVWALKANSLPDSQQKRRGRERNGRWERSWPCRLKIMLTCAKLT